MGNVLIFLSLNISFFHLLLPYNSWNSVVHCFVRLVNYLGESHLTFCLTGV